MVRTGLVLSQGGEFALVLFTIGVSAQLVDQSVAHIDVLGVTLSKATTPVLVAFGTWFGADKDSTSEPLEETNGPNKYRHHCGFWSVWSDCSRILTILEIPFTVIVLDPKRVEFVRQFTSEVYYGVDRRAKLASYWLAAPLPDGNRTRWDAIKGFRSFHPPSQDLPWR